jgi:dihydroorotase
MVANFSSNPAALLGVRGGTLAIGAPADITGLHLDRPWTVEPAQFRSLGKVTPFAGRTFKVRPALTIVGGAIAYRLGPDGNAMATPTAPAARERIAVTRERR